MIVAAEEARGKLISYGVSSTSPVSVNYITCMQRSVRMPEKSELEPETSKGARGAKLEEE